MEWNIRRLLPAARVGYARRDRQVPEVVVEHEFGHQYWYGMVATNEFEDAWMDEGINSYTEVKVLDSILGQQNLRV